MKRDFRFLAAFLAVLVFSTGLAAQDPGAAKPEDKKPAPEGGAQPGNGGAEAKPAEAGAKPADSGEKPAEEKAPEGGAKPPETKPEPADAPQAGKEPALDYMSLDGEVQKASFGPDGFGNAYYGDGTRFQTIESSEIVFFTPKAPAINKRFFALLKGAATIDFKKNPVSVKLPLGDAVFAGEGAQATLQVISDEKTGEQSVNVSNLSDKATVRIFLAEKQMEVGPGKTFTISAGAVRSIAKVGGMVVPAGEAKQEHADTFEYHVGGKGMLEVKFDAVQKLMAGQDSDLMLTLDRTGASIQGLAAFRCGFFTASLEGKSFKIKTPANRIVLNGSSFWTRIDPSGEWDRIQHLEGKQMTIESLRVPGFSVNVPLKGGADVIHPKDSEVVLLSVHKRIFELPPEGALEPEPSGKAHPEKSGKVLLGGGEFTVMIYTDGRPVSYRFFTDENDLAIPRGDAFRDAGDVKTVAEASPFLR